MSRHAIAMAELRNLAAGCGLREFRTQSRNMALAS